jgi:hypothetical protein
MHDGLFAHPGMISRISLRSSGLLASREQRVTQSAVLEAFHSIEICKSHGLTQRSPQKQRPASRIFPDRVVAHAIEPV